MGLVFNDLGPETKGISTKRLRYGRINTLCSNQASEDFQHSFQTQKPKDGKKKKKDEQSFDTFLTFFLNDNKYTEEIKEPSSLSCT